MTGTAILCSACGSAETVVVRENRPVLVAPNQEVQVPDEFTRCTTCGEEFYTRPQSLAASRARTGALRAAEGLLTPNEIVAIRQCLGLTQEQLERALGVGAKTVVRWERGTVRQSKAIDAILRIAPAFPDAFAFIASRNGIVLGVEPPVFGAPVSYSVVIKAPPTTKTVQRKGVLYQKVRVRSARSTTKQVRQAA